ncbi:hypothetical protein ACFL35_14740 [Candidatus Riflebacteria bacterium]
MKPREIMQKYNLTKSAYDSMLRRKRVAWGLKKNSEGSYTWDQAAIEKLEEYLRGRPAVMPAVVNDTSTDRDVEMTAEHPAIVSRKILAKLYRVEQSILENHSKALSQQTIEIMACKRKEIERLYKKIDDLNLAHSREVRILTEKLNSTSKRIGNAQVQFENKNRIIENRLERRKPATGLIDWFRKMLNTPIVTVDRRRN